MKKFTITLIDDNGKLSVQTSPISLGEFVEKMNKQLKDEDEKNKISMLEWYALMCLNLIKKESLGANKLENEMKSRTSVLDV